MDEKVKMYMIPTVLHPITGDPMFYALYAKDQIQGVMFLKEVWDQREAAKIMMDNGWDKFLNMGITENLICFKLLPHDENYNYETYRLQEGIYIRVIE